jgi:uncharacterized NAD(P)/FAD-binding protein YdhS
MLAARMAEQGLASTLVDRSGDFGRGVAYSTPFDGHLLNVRSGRMSAVDGDAGHFVRWLETHRPDHADPDGFAPRRVFGDYVQHRLEAVDAACPRQIARITGTVAEIAPDAVVLEDGRRLEARAVVLATGNPAPRTAPAGTSERVIGDPWAPGALAPIGAEDDVLIIGTGLTMVDMLLMLEGRGWRGRATALSRRGLMPRAHGARPDMAAPVEAGLLEGPLSERLALARTVAGREGWRSLMETLRPLTVGAWQAADPAMRSRIVRHLRPWWDVHRHRIAGSIADALERLKADDRLRLMAGRVVAIRPEPGSVAVDWKPRHGPARPALAAAWLIDCTGPGHDPARDPLTGPLLASGRARMDGLRLGLDLDDEGRVIDAGGRADDRLFVLGPPARAAFWETIAVPDIRKRIEAVAAALQ